MQGMDGIFQCIINPLKIFEISHTSKSTMYTGSSSPDSLARSESQERMSYTEAQLPDPITSGHFLGAWKQRCTLGKHDSLSEFPEGSHVFFVLIYPSDSERDLFQKYLFLVTISTILRVSLVSGPLGF